MSGEDGRGRGGMVKRYVSLVGGVVGVLAAGVAASILAERRVGARSRGQTSEQLGSLRGRREPVVCDDGLELHAEVDDLIGDGPTIGCPTLVFVHGHALNLDSWHFQRSALRGEYRMVFYDLRSHGRSARSRGEQCTIDQLGRDLACVLDQLAGAGPVVLVGHSMGGMTVMALAEQHPEWFGTRVIGVALISTTAGGLKASTLGFPGLPGRLVHLVTPALVATLARLPRLVEGGRRVGSDFGAAATRRLAFGTETVPQDYVDFADEMLAGTPIQVVADFFPGFDTHDKYAALSAIAQIPAVIICGGRDAITPAAHSRALAEQLSSAELVELSGAGHLVLFEEHDAVTTALRRMVAQTAGPKAGA